MFDRIEVAANWAGRRFSPERVRLLSRPEYPQAAEPDLAWDVPSMPRGRVIVGLGFSP